ncbi:MAG: hypothetical protein ACFE8B_15870 [Candidatus Hermodarchaeota archaeon]
MENKQRIGIFLIIVGVIVLIYGQIFRVEGDIAIENMVKLISFIIAEEELR